jgi:hypothetical protein
LLDALGQQVAAHGGLGFALGAVAGFA